MSATKSVHGWANDSNSNENNENTEQI
jgi:hypothetical protein